MFYEHAVTSKIAVHEKIWKVKWKSKEITELRGTVVQGVDRSLHLSSCDGLAAIGWSHQEQREANNEKNERILKAAEKGITDLGSDLTESWSQGPFENPYLEI